MRADLQLKVKFYFHYETKLRRLMSYGYTNCTSVQLGTDEIDEVAVTSERSNHMNIINR